MQAGDLRIGKLRNKISLSSPTRAEDPATGEMLTTWTPVATGVPAAIQSSQSEVERGNKIVAVTRHEVAIRYRTEWVGQTTFRITIDGQACEIVSIIDPDRRRRWLVITAIATV